MLDIAALERRWLKYKMKKLLPYGLAVIAITSLAFTLPWLLSNSTSAVSPASSKKEAVKVKVPSAANTLHDEKTIILEPSMNFMQSLSAVPAQTLTNTAIPAPMVSPKHSAVPDIIPSAAPKPSLSEDQTVIAQPLPTAKPPQPPVKGKLTTLKRDDGAFDIHEIEERFRNNSNPNLGLYIAHYHYEHGNYSEAYNYALKTNALNSNMDESWLIFAKSLVKLGKADQAKKALQLYISNSNSQSAKNYLETLNKETQK